MLFPMQQRFQDRREAGQVLSEKLSAYKDGHRQNILVLALPRGGVPVAYEVAKELHAELDIFLVRKLGVPGQEELAMGAIASGGTIVLNSETIEVLGIPEEQIEKEIENERMEILRRDRAYRGDRPLPTVKGRPIILVDDGLATGSTMRAAIAALRTMQPARLIVAVPVASRIMCEELNSVADEVICARTFEPFYGVGYWYEDFRQTTDQEVQDLLNKAVVNSRS